MLTVRLLGPPRIERDGVPAAPPRGRKAWALLSYLVLAERPPSRRHLAELLFGEAADPLGALRWTLAELRRALSMPGAFGGDPVANVLGDTVLVDVQALIEGAVDGGQLLELDGELLEGVDLTNCLDFEAWLVVAQHRVAAELEARLHDTAAGLLAVGRAGQAVPYAARAAARNRLEQGNHELLVRCLAAAGDRGAALRQVAVCEDLLRRELGIDATPTLRAAADTGPGSPAGPALSGRAAAVSQLEAGRAAVAAGAVEAGVQCLRRAAAEASQCRDPQLQAQALAALGAALVHAVRGQDEEGAIVLRQAIDIATRTGDRETVVTAQRELAFVEMQAGRWVTAADLLDRAQAHAETDAEFAAILGVRGMGASDAGDYPAAFAWLDESAERAAVAGNHRQEAWSLSLIGRARLLRAEHAQAAVAMNRSLELVQQQRWVAFQPWPQALQAELHLQIGDLDKAADAMAQAWLLACQIGDPCWEGLAARGLGLLHARRGDHNGAAEWLAEEQSRAIRVPDRYQWLHAHVLDAATAYAIERGDRAQARRLASALRSLAARCGLRELVVRAHLHQYRLGESAALSAARMLAADIDNPALDDLLDTPAVTRRP
jgi:DNA-binding SARP family transcriptional activator